MKTNYQVTFGYKAIISVDVKAESEDLAKEIASKIIKNNTSKLNSKGAELLDDSYSVDGILNVDNTWNMVN